MTEPLLKSPFSGMHTAIVQTDEQAKDAVALAAKRGLRIACVSNAGLKDGWKRITFLSEDAFNSPLSKD